MKIRKAGAVGVDSEDRSTTRSAVIGCPVQHGSQIQQTFQRAGSVRVRSNSSTARIATAGL